MASASDCRPCRCGSNGVANFCSLFNSRNLGPRPLRLTPVLGQCRLGGYGLRIILAALVRRQPVSQPPGTSADRPVTALAWRRYRRRWEKPQPALSRSALLRLGGQSIESFAQISQQVVDDRVCHLRLAVALRDELGDVLANEAVCLRGAFTGLT